MSTRLQGGRHIDFGTDPLASALATHILVCTISSEPVAGFLANFHDIIGTLERTV